MPTPAEIKRALLDAGFEVYQTRGDVVHVAERVRENLLMDSGVRIEATAPAVRFVVRAQRNDFPTDPDDHLFQRARSLAESALDRGYREVETTVTQVFDPGDSGRTLDTWCEVSFEKAAATVDEAMDEVRFVLALEKAVIRG
jgi:hypothetical protein